MKYGITQNLTADLTVNTDFAQVEVDEQQVNLTRFNLFFPEKRDFFLEGLGTFAFAGRASAGLGAGSRRYAVPVLQPPHRPRSIARDPAARRRPAHRQGRQVSRFGAHQRADRRRRHRAASTRRTSPCCAPSATSCGAAASAACSRIAPRRRGAPARTTASASTRRCRSTRTSASTRISPRHATEGRDGDDLSYRGFFDYNADRYGVQARTARRRAELPARDRLRAAHRHAAATSALAALQPAADRRAAPAQAHDAGEASTT